MFCLWDNAQIRCAVNANLVSAFVFFYKDIAIDPLLKSKISKASGQEPSLRLVCVGADWKP